MNPSRAIVALALALVVPSLAAAAGEGPLTLDEALARATRSNLDLVLAREDSVLAGADRTTAASGLLPRLDVTASFGQSRTGPSTRSFLNQATGEVITTSSDTAITAAYSASASLSQPLFDWQAYQNVRSSGAAARAAERRYDENVLGVAYEVTRLFYEAVRAERTLAVLEATVARTQELVTRADALFAAGRAPRSDTYTNRVNLANDRIAAEQQRARLLQARTALGQAIGLTGADAARLTVAAPAPIDTVERPGEPPPAERVLELAKQRRPQLEAAALQVKAADAAVSAAQGGYLPTVDAQLRYSRSGRQLGPLGNENAVWGDPSREYQASAGVVATWNLFEGRRTSAAVQRAESQARRARANQEVAALTVAREISDARAVASSRATQVGLASDNLATAQQALALARERLDAGLATQLEVREASLNLTRAELSLVEARIDHAVAIADLARASGGPL